VLRAFLRLVLSFLGAGLSAFAVAVIEARVVLQTLPEGKAAPAAVALAELGVLLPVALGVGGAVGLALLVLDAAGPTSPWDAFAAARHGPVLARLRNATLAPLVVLALYTWTIGTAYLARGGLSAGHPAESGLTVSLASVALLLAVLAVASALAPALRRVLAVGSSAAPALLDPALTGGIAVLAVGALFAVSLVTGDTSGGGGLLGIFGVLKRAELDLRPVANAAMLAAGAYLAPIVFARASAGGPGVVQPPRQGAFFGAAAGLVVFVVLSALCARSAGVLDRDAALAAGIEQHAPLGRYSLLALRRATDRDRDGFSPRFGGGDCDDRNPRINPSAVDVPGNGVDEDCSGADTPLPEPIVEIAHAKKPKRRSYNVLLITVDTLRVDLGFLGYPKPVSPNLDALAAKSTVFERAYAMASYTGKSVGPMLIGRYPSETKRDWSHFNTYAKDNLFVTERLRDAGVRTFAGHCHWYFRFPTGLNQGFQVWNTSAIPPGMGDNDNTVTSDRMSDLALQLLADPENVTPGAAPEFELDADGGGVAANAAGVGLPGAGEEPKRFFGWFHYFDPHAQYVAHEGAPAFTGPYPGKNAYDGEVWYTDKHIGRVLDYIATQPWAADTAIIVTADHGEAFAEHNMSWHGQEIWESVIRVPLVVYVPGEPGRRVPMKRSHIDLAPTILDLMGVEGADGEKGTELRGKSLLEDVLAPPGHEHEERDVFVDMPPGPFNGVRRAVITGPTPGSKLVHQGGGSYQLYDLANDPGELRDLGGDSEVRKLAMERMQSIRSRLDEIEVKPEER
jgi:arylsulfatase A-like enzyme